MSSWERQFSFTMTLSTQMYKREPVVIFLGRRAITNLSSGRYETLGLVTTLPSHLLIMEIGNKGMQGVQELFFVNTVEARFNEVAEDRPKFVR